MRWSRLSGVVTIKDLEFVKEEKRRNLGNLDFFLTYFQKNSRTNLNQFKIDATLACHMA